MHNLQWVWDIQGEHKVFPWLQTLQKNYVEYKHIQKINTWHNILETNLSDGKKSMFVFQVVLL